MSECHKCSDIFFVLSFGTKCDKGQAMYNHKIKIQWQM